MQEKLTVLLFAAEYLLTQDYENKNICEFNTRICAAPLSIYRIHDVDIEGAGYYHFLVDKLEGKSKVRLLNQSERINEIARMISGEKITNEAINFAKNLLK